MPFLGICLGMHLLFEEGVEGAPDEDDEASPRTTRADWPCCRAVVTKMPRVDAAGRACKVPHVGWNTVGSAGLPAGGTCAFAFPLFAGIHPGEHFYFTHGYVAPEGPFVVGETTHSTTFPSAVQYGDVAFGVQFHPEKSSDAGARLLRNFVSIVKGA